MNLLNPSHPLFDQLDEKERTPSKKDMLLLLLHIGLLSLANQQSISHLVQTTRLGQFLFSYLDIQLVCAGPCLETRALGSLSHRLLFCD